MALRKWRGKLSRCEVPSSLWGYSLFCMWWARVWAAAAVVSSKVRVACRVYYWQPRQTQYLHYSRDKRRLEPKWIRTCLKMPPLRVSSFVSGWVGWVLGCWGWWVGGGENRDSPPDGALADFELWFLGGWVCDGGFGSSGGWVGGQNPDPATALRWISKTRKLEHSNTRELENSKTRKLEHSKTRELVSSVLCIVCTLFSISRFPVSVSGSPESGFRDHGLFVVSARQQSD